MKLRQHFTPVAAWHLWHVLYIWVASHLALALALMFASGQSPFRRGVATELFGLDTGLVAFVMTFALTAYDRVRMGAQYFLANIGYSGLWQHVTTALTALVAETLLQSARHAWR